MTPPSLAMSTPLREVDLLVVGGGPAGLKTAEQVASRGHSVLVIESKKEIGSPVHTSGGSTPETMRRFKIPAELYHSLHTIRFQSLNEQVRFAYADPVGCIIDVTGVYQHLAAEARRAGAEVLTSHRLTAVSKDDRGFVTGGEVAGPEGRFPVRAKITIDATGYRAAVCKLAGLHPGFSRFGVGAEYELHAPHVNQDELLLIVGSRWAPAGYAWAFPWGGGRVRVGAGIRHPDVRTDPKELLQRVMDDAAELGLDLTDHQILDYHRGLIPSQGIPERLTADGLMVVGDAGGQATLVVGEGIRLALIAGEMAGNVASEALSEGRFDAERLAPYEHEFRRRYGRSLAVGGVINRMMSSFEDAEWDNFKFLRTLPDAVLPSLLLSEYPLRKILRGYLTRPRSWLPAAKAVLQIAAKGVKAKLKR